MKIGYARVSSEDQTLAGQIRELAKAGCKKTFRDKISGATQNRPQLAKMLKGLCKGDTVVVVRLDRISRSLSDLLQIMRKIDVAGATFLSLSEHIETKSPAGRAMMHMLGVFAEFEREMLLARTRAGIEAARAAGTHMGRPATLDPLQRAALKKMLENKEGSRRYMAGVFKVSVATINREANRMGLSKVYKERADG